MLAAPPSNLPPAFNENAPITRSFPEDAAIGANVGLPVLATDPDDDTLRYGYNTVGTSRFQVNSVSGQINMNSNLLLSYERRPTSYIWVLVRDSKDQYGNADTEWDASALVKINITNVEEAGEVELTSDNPQVAVELAASLTDPDGSVTNLTWQWQTASSAQATTWTDITVATSEKYTPVAADVGKFVRAHGPPMTTARARTSRPTVSPARRCRDGPPMERRISSRAARQRVPWLKTRFPAP